MTSWLRSLIPGLGRGAVDPAAQARVAQAREFRAAVHQQLARDVEQGDRAALEALLRKPGETGLPDEEVELEIERVQGALDLLALREQVAAAGLPIVEHQHKSLGADRCHFRASAFLASDGSDRTGRLFLTERRLVFVASPMIAVAWSAVGAIEQKARDLVIVPVAGETLYQFRCNSFSDASCGAFIAQTLKRQILPKSTPPRDSSGTAADGPPGSR